MTPQPHPLDSETIYVALFDLASAIGRLEEALDSVTEADDLAHLLRALDWTKDDPKGLKQRLDTFVAQVKRALVAHVGFDHDLIVEDIGLPITRTLVGANARWDWERIVPRVAAQVADEEGFDPVDGVAVPPGVLAEKVGAAVADCAGLTASKAGRKTSLTKRGIDWHDFVESDGGTPSTRWKTT